MDGCIGVETNCWSATVKVKSAKNPFEITNTTLGYANIHICGKTFFLFFFFFFFAATNICEMANKSLQVGFCFVFHAEQKFNPQSSQSDLHNQFQGS